MMLNRYLLAPLAALLLLAAAARLAHAQTGGVRIGTAGTPDASAALDISSTSKGLLLPRLTLAQRDAMPSPAGGLVVFQTDNTPGLYAYDGTAWVRLGADNLGNHTATQNLNLADKLLVGGTAAAPGTAGLTLSSSGNLGLGTTAAQPATQKLDVRSNLRLGDDGGNVAGAGQAIEWVGPGFSTDPVGVYRLNTAADQSELRVVVGDVADANDKFVVGRMAGTNAEGGIPAGSFTPTFSVSSAGQVTAPALAGTGTRVLGADATGTLTTTNVPGDNLGNHTATQALNLQGNALTGTGASIGGVGVGVRADGGLNLGQNGVGNNVLLGFQAGQSLTPNVNNNQGVQNQFFGYQSGQSNTTGSYNLFNGYQSGYSNTTGSVNQFSGYFSGFSNVGGSNNVFSGTASGYSNTTGSANQFIGFQSGSNNWTGNQNVFSGYQSGQYNITGNGNVFSGYQSGYYNLTGSNNTALGYNSGPQGSLTNTVALGANATVSTNNTIQLGDANITNLRCQVGLTITSDARFKYDVRADVPGLAFLTALRPVTYRFDEARLGTFTRTGTLPARSAPDPAAPLHTGFLAQEVEAAAQALGFGFDGVHAPANARDYYGLNYAQFVVPLVRAVQELSSQVEALQAEKAALKARAALATATLETFEARLRRLEAGSEGQALR